MLPFIPQLMGAGALGFRGRNVVRLVELENVSAIVNAMILLLSLEVFLVKEKRHRKIYVTKEIAQVSLFIIL